jgi:hypothetical protein
VTGVTIAYPMLRLKLGDHEREAEAAALVKKKEADKANVVTQNASKAVLQVEENSASCNTDAYGRSRIKFVAPKNHNKQLAVELGLSEARVKRTQLHSHSGTREGSRRRCGAPIRVRLEREQAEAALEQARLRQIAADAKLLQSRKDRDAAKRAADIAAKEASKTATKLSENSGSLVATARKPQAPHGTDKEVAARHGVSPTVVQRKAVALGRLACSAPLVATA